MQPQSERPSDWADVYWPQLFRAALILMKNTADAEDIVQDVFIKALTNPPALESDEHEKAWLLRVTINLCKDRLRSARIRTAVPLTEEYPARDDVQRDVIEMVLALPLKYRTVIHLFYYEGYSSAEIAGITRQKEPAVRNQLSRARKRLRLLWDEQEG